MPDFITTTFSHMLVISSMSIVIHRTSKKLPIELKIFIIIIIIITAIDFLVGGSRLYTSKDKTIKKKIYLKETINKEY